MARTVGCDLETPVVHKILNDTVPLNYCRPKELFRLEHIGKNGVSSEWAVFGKYWNTLNELLDAATGLIPKHKFFLQQFIEWLESQTPPIVWAWKDSDRCVMHLRTMLQSLLAMKRNARRAPRSHGKVQVLIDKVQLGGTQDLSNLKDSSEEPDPSDADSSDADSSDKESGNSSESDDMFKNLEKSLFPNKASLPLPPPAAPSASSDSLPVVPLVASPNARPLAECFQRFCSITPGRSTPALMPLQSDSAHAAAAMTPAKVEKGKLLDANALAALSQVPSGSFAPLVTDFTDMKKNQKRSAAPTDVITDPHVSRTLRRRISKKRPPTDQDPRPAQAAAPQVKHAFKALHCTSLSLCLIYVYIYIYIYIFIYLFIYFILDR